MQQNNFAGNSHYYKKVLILCCRSFLLKFSNDKNILINVNYYDILAYFSFKSHGRPYIHTHHNFIHHCILAHLQKFELIYEYNKIIARHMTQSAVRERCS